MSVGNTITGIDANLDDLQSGVEASARAADNIQSEVAEMSKQNGEVRSLTRRALELQTCARAQRDALAELRENIARLKLQLSITPGSR